MGRTLFEKIWESHLVGRRADGRELLYMDRNVVHELHAPTAYKKLELSGRKVARPDLTFAALDHTVSAFRFLPDGDDPGESLHIRATREGSNKFGVRVFDVGDDEHGISHVVAPELGLVLPGMTYACCDSHACTVGGIGVLAYGSGTSELEHVLATQVLALVRPKTMRVRLDGALAPGVTAKDVILRIIGECGLDAGRGHTIEYAGPVMRAMPVEGRLTVCNMAIEMGARNGMVAPDDATFEWLSGRRYAPEGAAWDAAVAEWRTLASDDDAVFDTEVAVDCDALEPQVTWGTDPSQTMGVSGRIPDPAASGARAEAARRALDYMDLRTGAPIAGTPINKVFIGSCTNSRVSDLEDAARVLRGRKVAAGVTALAVAGSHAVKREAEAKGLDKVFRDAGFVWGESGCSMCAGGHGDHLEPGDRSVSTTNRNFEGRQGPGVRTHLVSPAMAAAAAVAGEITDVRRLVRGDG